MEEIDYDKLSNTDLDALTKNILVISQLYIEKDWFVFQIQMNNIKQKNVDDVMKVKLQMPQYLFNF